MPIFHIGHVEQESELSTRAISLSPPQTIAELPSVEEIESLFTAKRLRMRRGMVVWIWTFLAPFAALGFLISLMNGDWAWTLSLGFIVATAWQLNRQAVLLEQSQAALQTRTLDRRWFGALCEALEWPQRKVQAVARQHLATLLPHVQEEDAEYLTEEQRACLYHQLNVRDAIIYPKFVSAILRSSGSIGDEQAIPGVKRLATSIAFWPSLRRTRREARVSLPLLEQRVLQQRLTHATPEMTPASAIQPAHAAESATAGPKSSEIPLQTPEAERRKQEHPAMRLGFLIAFWCIVVPYFGYLTCAEFARGDRLLALPLGALTLIFTQSHRLALTSKHRELASRLAKLDDVQAVGPLAEALEWPDKYIQRIAARALTRLLPRLHASDAALLNPAQRACLYHKLKMENARTQENLLIAILKALQQVGDQNAVSYVQALADRTPFFKEQREVRDAASACLPFLQEHAKQTQYSQTLLRASSETSTPPEVLLRPAYGSPESHPAQLLHPGVAEDSA
jgi:hypothetical protein